MSVWLVEGIGNLHVFSGNSERSIVHVVAKGQHDKIDALVTLDPMGSATIPLKGKLTHHTASSVVAKAVKSLYMNRHVKNGAEIRKWYMDQGFTSTLDPADMHVTIVYSRMAMDWKAVGKSVSRLVVPISYDRWVTPLGDKGALVLGFRSEALQLRHAQFRFFGASHDYPEYTPHVTITYEPQPVPWEFIVPYYGEIVFGAERFAELDTNFKSKESINA
jgi:hypothetical protein